MTDGAVRSQRTFGRKIKDMDRDIQKLTAKINSNISVQTFLGSKAVSAINPGGEPADTVRRVGDTMTGPLGFEPGLVTIANGAIDIGEETDFHQGRIIINTESGTADNLVAIENPKFNGQLLFLQGIATKTVTLVDAVSSGTAWATSTGYSLGNQVTNGGVVYVCKSAHTSAAADEPGVGASWEDKWIKGNLETIDGETFDLEDDDIIILQYDSTDARWQQVTIGKQSGAATEIVDGDTKVVVNDTTPDVQIQLDGVTLAAWNVDGSGDERLLFSGAYVDLNGVSLAGVENVIPDNDIIRITDETVIHALSGYLGFVTGSNKPTTLGNSANVGCIQAPYKEDTDDSPSSSTLNNWFGNIDGCIGLQYDNDTPDVFTLWARLNGTWHKVTLT